MRPATPSDFNRLYETHLKPLKLKGFRRARNYGFLHPNRKRLIHLL
ncbi:hypothetical protein TVNIR_1689 [Thioalkalivibrio nitratireducens DSM 14787]|uniref:Uncharacterized protein n=1 Tax=Thioalkalivibrio nitratireducens (strain DSM 14787 / UNIQEM 213 / ALEN2) TaxID=1255043 RepID=L0DWF0_THIND|nr:hypothetical protein TVNIR_1689 [Thioalkalivibrio nitratireducens DSM 14787]